MRETLIAKSETITSDTLPPPPSSPSPNLLDQSEWLHSKNRPFSVEVCPNRDLDFATLSRIAPRMCSVTWHARTAEEGMAAVRLAGRLRQQDHVVLLHLAGRNLSEADVVEVLEAAKSFGVRNLFVLQGDSATHSEPDDAKCDFPYASYLVKFIREKYDRYFLIGVAGYPEKHPQSHNQQQDIDNLKKKVTCGADFIITQACFDFQSLSSFAKLCRSEGILVPIIPGIFIISSWRALNAMSDSCSVPIPKDVEYVVERNKQNDEVVQKFGVQMATQIVKNILSDEEGLFQGFHVFTLNNFTLLTEVLGRMGLCEVDEKIL